MVHLGDITKMSGYTIPPVDVITFGSPCQDLSIAGKRAGMAGERSGLFSEAVRIIREMRYATFGAYPKYAVWENVPGAFSSNKGEDFHAVLQSLCRVIDPDATIPRPTDARGGIKWPRAGAILADHYSLAWRTMDAQHWGVPQRRLRISLVLDLAGGRAGEILFEPESLRGHFAPGITPGQAAPRTAENGAGTADCTDAIPVNLQIATRHKSLGERTGLGIGQAVGMMRPGGTVVLNGLPPGDFPLSIYDMVMRAITLRGSIVGTRYDLGRALHLAAQEKIAATVQTARLQDINEVMEHMQTSALPGRTVLELG